MSRRRYERPRAFVMTFRKYDPWECVVAEAIKALPYGYGKTIFVRMLRTFFDDCRDPESLRDAIMKSVDEITSHVLVDSVRDRYKVDAGMIRPKRPSPKREFKELTPARQQEFGGFDALAG